MANPTSAQLIASVEAHFAKTNNPHKVKSTQIYELWNVENTADSAKPVSKALQEEMEKYFSMTDVYNSSVDDPTKDLTKIPWSAAQGKVLNDTITVFVNGTATTEIAERITALENILK